MTRRRRITRIVSAFLLVVAPAACAESIDDPIETVDSGKTDTAVNPDGGTPDTATNPPDTATTNPPDTDPPADTDVPPDVCTASCTSDSDCTSLCSSFPGTWCCDTSSSVCYAPSTGTCSTVDPGDGGGGGDGGSD